MANDQVADTLIDSRRGGTEWRSTAARLGGRVMSDLRNEKTEDEMVLEPEISDESLEAAAGGRVAYTYLFFCTQMTCPGIEVL